MPEFTLPAKVTIGVSNKPQSPCYEYAVAELERLLGRLKVLSARIQISTSQEGYGLLLQADPEAKSIRDPSLTEIRHDGFTLSVGVSAIGIHAPAPKGILNGVYELAEQMGFLFILPTEQWEWIPAGGRAVVSIPCGETRKNPRFAWRGVYGTSSHDFTLEQWLRFYAKIRFNAVGAFGGEYAELAEELGIRLETGGHGLPGLLPRKMYDENPEMFRMNAPMDLHGKRVNDSNLCSTNPDAKRIIQQRYVESLQGLNNVYAVHAWPDDLYGDGWCKCPLCRYLTASDQYALAMRHLSEAVEEHNLDKLVPMIAYHDTLFPPRTVKPPHKSFLLYAPRERCYGHALDDETCHRNRLHYEALQQWMALYDKNSDAHTFEYYFDQVLFRGLYPFIPQIILDDMRVYEQIGIRSHMSIHVWGPEYAPEFNMLVFAKGHWDATLTTEKVITELAGKLSPENPSPWKKYLESRSRIFEDAMRFCDYSLQFYLDYRWLPETTLPFALEMVSTYNKASETLVAAADELFEAIGRNASGRMQELVGREHSRAIFESAELKMMAFQQDGLNNIAKHLATGDYSALPAMTDAFKRACDMREHAKKLALQAGVPEEAGYHNDHEIMQKEWKLKHDIYIRGSLLFQHERSHCEGMRRP